jgi:hypothetical protein
MHQLSLRPRLLTAYGLALLADGKAVPPESRHLSSRCCNCRRYVIPGYNTYLQDISSSCQTKLRQHMNNLRDFCFAMLELRPLMLASMREFRQVAADLKALGYILQVPQWSPFSSCNGKLSTRLHTSMCLSTNQ